MLTTAHALLTEEPDADADRIRAALSGNLCRCTGYIPIVEAVLEARAAYQAQADQAMIGTNRYIGSPVERDRGPALSARPRRIRRRPARARACCMPRSCAAPSRMAASADRRGGRARDARRARRHHRGRHRRRCRRSRCACCRCPATRAVPAAGDRARPVRYVGEPVAVVLADSAALAEDGVDAIALDIEELPPVAGSRRSGAARHAAVRGAGTNVAMIFTRDQGRCRRGVSRRADYVRRERFRAQRHTALPMEPRGVLAEWDAAAGEHDRLGAAKVPFFNRRHPRGDAGPAAGRMSI